MVHAAGASHIGGCLSVADILAVLYEDVLNISPSQVDLRTRDRFILSKGHAAAAVYAVLALKGFFAEALLDSYCQQGSSLIGHANHAVPGVEFSTGSLGHGLPIAAGVALAGQRDSLTYRTVALLSDGELDEGAVWEAALFAGHHKLSRLVAIIDYNKIQSLGRVADVLDLEPLADKWRAFRWDVHEIDGHDHQALKDVLRVSSDAQRPKLVIAHTLKGKGVDFMENKLEWHYKTPNADELQRALLEINDR